MTTATHTSKRVLEQHTSVAGDFVSELVAERTPLETARLRSLAATISPVRLFGVERSIISSAAKDEAKGAPRSHESRTVLVLATSGAEAARLANAHKYEVERQLGHHKGCSR